MISSLTITISLFYLLVAIIASAMLRTSSAPFAVKIIVPSLVVALACFTYKTLPEMFGFPVETDFASLPRQAELIAFHPYDDEKKVDLWLAREGEPQPRAYSVELTDDLKDTLRKAQKTKNDGGRAMLAKVAKPSGQKRPSYTGIDGGNAPYTLLPNAFTLPKKDSAQ
jgi:hypothetical protein